MLVRFDMLYPEIDGICQVHRCWPSGWLLEENWCEARAGHLKTDIHEYNHNSWVNISRFIVVVADDYM
jgi:hypothetical protein